MLGQVSGGKYLLALCIVLTVSGITRQLMKTNRLHKQRLDDAEMQLLKPVPPAFEARTVSPVGGRTYRIAIGGAITSKGTNLSEPDHVRSLSFFWQLLPSFCRTASLGYEYHFYFGYDWTDPIANETMLAAMEQAFRRSVQNHCAELNVSIGRLNMIRCQYEAKPAWAQNDAMMAAYLDGMDFFYRLNDDTRPVVSGWTEVFIGTLARLSPPFVGVVGPSCTLEPSDIMSHDFVHRTHIEIFGFYYPRTFTDWFADTWISHVYRPARSIKFSNITVDHTEMMGRRYTVRKYGLREMTLELVQKHQKVISRYINAKFLPAEKPMKQKSVGDRVIAMSLYGSNPRYVYGAIRNAQLVPIVYPGWRLRVYYHPKSDYGSGHDLRHLYVAENVLESLRRLGVELVQVTDPTLMAEPGLWRYLALDDHQNVEYAMIRNVDARITSREARLVNEWLAADLDHTLYCIRDHPSQGITPLMAGLWGGKGKNIKFLLGKDIKALLLDYLRVGRTQVEQLHSTNSFLMNVWNGTLGKAYCHDSVTCQVWAGSHPAARLPDERQVYVGQRFDAFDDGVTFLNISYYGTPECAGDHTSATDIR